MRRHQPHHTCPARWLWLGHWSLRAHGIPYTYATISMALTAMQSLHLNKGLPRRAQGGTQIHRTAVPRTQLGAANTADANKCTSEWKMCLKEFTRQETTLKSKKANDTFKGKNLEIVQVNSGANQFLKKLCITAITFIGRVEEK